MPSTNDTTAERKLLDAAKQIVLKEGYEAVTVRKVAERAGYTFPLLYHYYRDLDDLLWALRLDMIDDMVARLAGGRKENRPSMDGLQKAFLDYMEYFFQFPNVYRFFYFHDFRRPEDETGYQAMEQRLLALRSGYLEMLEKKYPGQEELMVRSIIYAIHGMLTLALSTNGNFNQQAAVKELSGLMAFFFEGNTEP